MQLGFGLVARSFDADLFTGFPVMRADVEYDGLGYLAMFGWLQLVTHQWPSLEQPDTHIDLAPELAELDRPLCGAGYLPTFFDAPANPDHPDGDWIAETFLVVSPTGSRPKELAALAGFRWGYHLASGRPTLLPLEASTRADWSRCADVLRAPYPSWFFVDSV